MSMEWLVSFWDLAGVKVAGVVMRAKTEVELKRRVEDYIEENLSGYGITKCKFSEIGPLTTTKQRHDL